MKITLHDTEAFYCNKTGKVVECKLGKNKIGAFESFTYRCKNVGSGKSKFCDPCSHRDNGHFIYVPEEFFNESGFDSHSWLVLYGATRKGEPVADMMK